MNKLKRLFFVSRPVSWINTAFPFAAGWLITGTPINEIFIVGTVFFLIPYNLLMYGINDVFDYESDIRNPRKGGIEGMREERALHPLIVRASIGLSIPFFINLLLIGSVFSKLVLIVLLFFVVAYSIKGLRFKEIPFLDSISSSIHFVGPLVYALSLTAFVPHAWPVILAFFLWGMASHAFGAVQDIIPDREGKLSSIATVLGARRTVYLCLALYLAGTIVAVSQGGLIAIAGEVGLLYAANVFPFMDITDVTSAAANTGWRRFIWLNLFAGFVVTLTVITRLNEFHHWF